MYFYISNKAFVFIWKWLPCHPVAVVEDAAVASEVVSRFPCSPVAMIDGGATERAAVLS